MLVSNCLGLFDEFYKSPCEKSNVVDRKVVSAPLSINPAM